MTAERKTYPEIAVRLRAVRKAYSTESRRGWAAACKFNATQYTNWENGSRRIPLEAAERLSQKFGLTLDWIYLGRWDGLPARVRADLAKYIDP